PELHDIELKARELRGNGSRQGKIDAEKYLYRAMAEALQDRLVAFEYTNEVEDAASQRLSLLVVRGANVTILGKAEKIEQSELEAARPELKLHQANASENQSQELAPHILAREELRNRRPPFSRTKGDSTGQPSC